MIPSEEVSTLAAALATLPADEPAAAGDVHARRRDRFMAAIGDGVAVLASAPELVRSRDTAIRFRQDSYFHYLTGFDEPGVAILTPHDPAHRLTLFVRPRDPDREVWDGARAGVDGARERYGADAAYPLAELGQRLKELVEPASELFYALGSSPRLDGRIVALLKEFRLKRSRSGKGPADVRDPSLILDAMRVVKGPEEVELVRRAARLSAQGHLAALRAAHPGVGEWELEAAIESTFRAAGPDCGPAYPSIVCSGPNATVLHYAALDRRAAAGELVLIDAGAAVSLYCGDITRTFPVSGRFTAPQRAVYDVVLAALEAGIAAVRPGAPFSDLHAAVLRVLVEGMVELGLLSGEVDALIEQEGYKRFYMHQTSHWLGLDVHDAGDYRARAGDWLPLRPGMVLTVEPGLYVAADAEDVPDELRGIGVRIEDDVLVTEGGHEVLTRDVPVAAEELEALIGR
ncbi:MAG TPA: aminopeptidase P N-terminal domain-containing protein [Longimicrobiaceae bacterium]|nr:aminopeptidase P N-terminal domain-containing protein [Longimicrobiaceae bacterium]